jgi:hypothetical protein
MDAWFEFGRKLLEFHLPSLPVYVKIGLSAVTLALCLVLLVSMWRSPASLAALNPITHQRLEKGVSQFFRYYKGLADPPEVYGEAKDIVRRMKTEGDVFPKIDAEIEARKRNDNNWYPANRLASAKALVNALGLTHETKAENEVFLQMPLPDLRTQ